MIKLAENLHWENITGAQKIERWENVERVLVNLPAHERANHWDMSVWGNWTPCGTVACAAGHCGMDPWFRERGFKMDMVIYDAGKSAEDPDNWDAELVEPLEFFGQDGCRRIFYQAHRRSVEWVIEEVREYIEELKEYVAAELE